MDRSWVSEHGWQSSVKHVGADPWTTRYINEQSLYEILASIGNQCSLVVAVTVEMVYVTVRSKQLELHDSEHSGAAGD